jgi:DNA topoisomerase-3
VTVAVLAEKPAVARDIARVLGATKRGEGYLHGSGYVVTWAVGHLVTLAEPHQMRPEWRRWSQEALPLLPATWPLVVLEDTGDQFGVVKRILTSKSVSSVVCATDAGREGELIFRYIYEATGSTLPASRLWVSSLTDDAIRQGFARLRDAGDFDPLADAARGRARADWLVGMNLSRACSLAFGETLPVGRVQTPTLAFVVERELLVRAFVPEDYVEAEATFSPREGASYRGVFFRGATASPESRRLPADGEEARRIVERALAGEAAVSEARRETRRTPPPLLYDLTELQRHANRLFGYSARQTLGFAQSLYEQKKLLSYPRTDSRHLTRDVAATLPAVVSAIAGRYQGLLAPGTPARPLGRRFVDDAEVGDHHALMPTDASPEGVALSEGERAIYDLVCRRLLMAWHDDHVASFTTVITQVQAQDARDRYHSSGTTVEQAGWKVLDPPARKGESEEAELPAGLEPGQGVKVEEARAVPKKTRPPKRYTDATLLSAMETAGRVVDDRELSQAMKDSGLGTPATRAETIETLIRHGYLERQGRSLAATEKGIRLIGLVHPHAKSPAMTGEWEALLARIEKRQARLPVFMEKIEAFVREVVAGTLASPPPEPAAAPSSPAAARVTDSERAPRPVSDLSLLLREIFRLESFRPYQEAVCRAVTEGRDVLLVMPTGAGKSLCYQLPGVARGGATLVVSPLIALMEDQVARLKALGLRAERVHSGRDRAASRQALEDYAQGRLDFLFVAPERLGVPGFAERLARRKPALVAVDEAHCISHWGHDFRPDYRLLGQRLPSLRPAPIMALTATATARVRDDIAEQLGLARAARFVHGFRRTNIAVEVAEAMPSARASIVGKVLAEQARRPAVVYAPTRKEAEGLAGMLNGHFGAAPYHAGLPAPARGRAQSRFQSGQLDVVVATIAFGMGIDKADIRSVIHTGLPASVEGYYQEIGRAGRDGKPSRAILLYSYVDRKTHEYFFERDYPDVAVLERLRALLRESPEPRESLRRRASLAPVACDAALEKLWIHGGARIDGDAVARGEDAWRAGYLRQREHKLAQLDLMLRLAESHRCRMLQLVEHFGDSEDSGRPCGQCDVCAPDASQARRSRATNPAETALATAVLERLRSRDGLSTGVLFRDVGAALERRAFEAVLGGLVRAGLVVLEDDSFVKDGRTIRFQRATLTRTARAGGTVELAITEPLVATGATSRHGGNKERKPKAQDEALRPPDPALVAALKVWRLAEARRRKLPAFHVLHDRVLMAVAAARPRTEDELLAVKGMGPGLLKKYGPGILQILRR